MVALLKEYKDVFAWTYEDMPGLDPELVEHHLVLYPEATPVKQKLWRLHLNIALQVRGGQVAEG